MMTRIEFVIRVIWYWECMAGDYLRTATAIRWWPALSTLPKVPAKNFVITRGPIANEVGVRKVEGFDRWRQTKRGTPDLFSNPLPTSVWAFGNSRRQPEKRKHTVQVRATEGDGNLANFARRGRVAQLGHGRPQIRSKWK